MPGPPPRLHPCPLSLPCPALQERAGEGQRVCGAKIFARREASRTWQLSVPRRSRLASAPMGLSGAPAHRFVDARSDQNGSGPAGPTPAAGLNPSESSPTLL